MTDREKIIKALAPLHASDTAVQEVLEMAEHRNTHTMKKRGRTLLIAAVVAVLLIGTALAATYPSWSPGLQRLLRITDGELAALEETELVSRPPVSDTHDGVTICLEQAVVDGGTAIVSLRVEGLEVPEGQIPVPGQTLVTIDGENADGWGFSVYDDLLWEAEGVVYSDGTPAEQNADGVYIPHAIREDGSFEIDVYFGGLSRTDMLVGKEITIVVDRLGVAPIGGTPMDRVWTAEGPWELTWTAEGSETVREWTLNEPLFYGITLTGVKLSPISLRLDFAYPPLTNIDGTFCNEDGQAFVELEPFVLAKLVMKDGTEYTGIFAGGSGGPEVDNDGLAEPFAYRYDRTLNRVIDPDEVAALIFGVGNGPAGRPAEYYTVTLPD